MRLSSAVLGTLAIVIRARRQGVLASASEAVQELSAAGLSWDDEYYRARLEAKCRGSVATMIDAQRLLDDLKRLLRRLEDDLRVRSQMVDVLHDALQREYQTARDAGRTGEAFEAWREGMLTQAAVAWLLGCVFVRFVEDNGLVDEPLLSGSHERRQQAAERQMDQRAHPRRNLRFRPEK